MATVTLKLYSGCRIIKDKNFVVDDIETYLSTLDYVTIDNFQYQRFDLKKKINLDLDQVWQTKKTSLPYGGSTVPTKWNYCKITSDTIDYYYFVTGYKQVSPKTVELSLEMDTLNTFKYYYAFSNSTYTLSPKTIVKREHKNRFAALNTLFSNRDSTAEERYAFGQLDSWNYYQNTSDEQVNLLLNIEGLKEFMTGASLNLLELDCVTQNGAYIQFKNHKYTNVLELWFELSEDSITIYTSQVQASVPMNEVENNFVLVIPAGGALTLDFKTYSGDWTLFINDSIYLYISADIIDNRFKRLIDPFQEGIATTLFKTWDETLYDADETKHWMLAYRNDQDTGTTVNTLLYPENEMTVSTQSAIEVSINPTQIPNKVNQGELLKFMHNGDYEAGNYVKVNGTSYEVVSAATALSGNKVHGVCAYKQNANDTTFKYIYTLEITGGSQRIWTAVASKVSEIKAKGWGNAKIYTTYYTDKPESGGYWQDYWVGSKSSITSGTVQSWKDVKLYDTKLIKAFIFPYCPSQFLAGRTETEAIPNAYKYLNTVAGQEKAFQLLSANNNDFTYEINFENVINPQAVTVVQIPEAELHTGVLRKIKFESKLYHSDYYQPKFVYDSFSYPFYLEDLDIDTWLDSFPDYQKFSVNYTVSTNIVSKFAFQFLQYVTKRTTQDYEAVLAIERNNEKALYNSDYLNYIKNGGYSYDQKKANSQNAINGITTALSIVGAVASFASSGVTGGAGVAAGVGLAVGATAGLARGIYTAQEQDKAISQKMLQAQMQGTTVEGSEDLDILTVLTENKAKLVLYQLSDIMKQAMADLFHYCGYATYEQKIPSVYTRTYFNFVQAEIEYKEYTFNEDIAEDIKNKWAAGITFLHHVGSSWDFNQQYENWEVSLLS